MLSPSTWGIPPAKHLYRHTFYLYLFSSLSLFGIISMFFMVTFGSGHPWANDMKGAEN